MLSKLRKFSAALHLGKVDIDVHDSFKTAWSHTETLSPRCDLRVGWYLSVHLLVVDR